MLAMVSVHAQLASYITQDNLPRNGITHSGLDPPKSVSIQDSVLQASHRPTQWRQFFKEGSLSPGDSRL